jgi:hypothetical protein
VFILVKDNKNSAKSTTKKVKKGYGFRFITINRPILVCHPARYVRPAIIALNHPTFHQPCTSEKNDNEYGGICCSVPPVCPVFQFPLFFRPTWVLQRDMEHPCLGNRHPK